MKNLRLALPVLALAALASAGCFLISGQFVVSYELPTPFNATMNATITGVDVDLNTISEYSDHKSDLKRVDDLALIGSFKNNAGAATTVYCWIVPAGGTSLTPLQVSTQGKLLWGPLTLASGETKKVDWNASAALFKGRQTLIDEIKGDGHFSLFVTDGSLLSTAPGQKPAGVLPAFDLTITNGAVIAVVGAAK